MEYAALVSAFTACTPEEGGSEIEKSVLKEYILKVVSCRVVSCRVVSCRVVSCRVVAWRGVAWPGVAWRGVAWLALCGLDLDVCFVSGLFSFSCLGWVGMLPRLVVSSSTGSSLGMDFPS